METFVKILHIATWILGIVGGIMAFYFPKSDKRFKSGYKDNDEAWGCLPRLIGLGLMGLAFVILKWGFKWF